MTLILSRLSFGDTRVALAFILLVVIPFNFRKGTINGAAARIVDAGVNA